MDETDSKIRTLIVEDHHLFRNALESAMSLEEAIEVVGSHGAPEEAVAEVKRRNVDVLVTDLMWRSDPLGGIKLIHRVLALSPETKVLVCSAHDGEEMIRRAVQAGVKGYLLKDEVKAVDVVEAIKATARDEPAFSDTVVQIMARMLQEASDVSETVEPLEELTSREREIVPLIIDGLTNAEIANRLSVATKTVKTHVSHILQKLGLQSRHQVAGYINRRENR